MYPPLPRHLEPICRRDGDTWTDADFASVVDWLNETPGHPQPPLRFLLNLTTSRLKSRHSQEAVDCLQDFFTDRHDNYRKRLKKYKPAAGLRDDISPYFWTFLTNGLKVFCRRWAWRQNRERTQVEDAETGEKHWEAVQLVSFQREDETGRLTDLEVEDTNPESRPEEALKREALRQAMGQLFDQLTPLQKRVWEAFLKGDASREQIAADLGITTNYLYVIICRIRGLLKKILDSESE